MTFLLYFGHYLPEKGRFPFCAAKQLKNGMQRQKRTKNEQITDSDIMQIIQKLIKELAEGQENYKKVNNTQEVENLDKQIAFCKNFLPKELSQEEIKEIIVKMEDKSIPSVMKHFKANYAGQVDMKLVQEVLKSL